MFILPKKGTLERILHDKLIKNGKLGVVAKDLVGTGITTDNIDQIINNLRTGMFESDTDFLLKEDS